MIREDFFSEIIELLDDGADSEDPRVMDLIRRAENDGFDAKKLLYDFLKEMEDHIIAVELVNKENKNDSD